MKNFIKAIYRHDTNEIKKIIENGFDINSTDEEGRTGLIYAVLDSEVSADIVLLLLNYGIDINIVDKSQKWSALHFAVQDNKHDIVRVLLEKGAQVDITDSYGNTPLSKAIFNFNGNTTSIENLIYYGANPDRKNLHGVSPKDLCILSGKSNILKLLQKHEEK